MSRLAATSLNSCAAPLFRRSQDAPSRVVSGKALYAKHPKLDSRARSQSAGGIAARSRRHVLANRPHAPGDSHRCPYRSVEINLQATRHTHVLALAYDDRPLGPPGEFAQV